jgi:hypothetical protein
MLKKIIPGLVLLTMLACSSGGLFTPTPDAARADAEEAVYVALLRAMYPAGRYVLTDATQSSLISFTTQDDALDYISEQMQGVDGNAIEVFLARNDRSYPLRADMDLGAPYILLSEEEMNEIFGGSQDGWEAFYGRYPDAPGIITLSRVGFNAEMDQALVYIGNQSHWLAGAGYYVLLEKVDGAWVITQQVMAWIS